MPNNVKKKGAKTFWWCDKTVLATLLVVAMVLPFVGCQSSAPGRGLLHQGIHPESDVSANAEQARLRIRVLVEPFCGRVASTADQIMASTTNQTIRREALLWKIQAVPIMRETLFHANPYIALGDAWVFLTQMDGYFQSGPGRQALGDSAPIAAAACASLEKQLTEVAASFTHSGNVTDVRTFIQKWAADHPIKQSIAGRESVVSYFTRRNLQATFSAPEAAADVDVTMNDLSRRFDIYSGQLLDQSRWQAELFATDLAREYHLDKTAADLDKTVAVLDTAPLFIDSERGAVQQAVHEEVSRTIQFAKQETTAMFAEVTKEQTAALLELHRTISEERTAFTQDLEQLSFKVVDHAFLRIAQLAGGIVLVIFVGFVVLLYLTRRLFLTTQTTRRAVPLHRAPPAPGRKHGASRSRRRYPSL
jgi:hypothetical protein